jgi:2,4-dienoyl-CoA reductase-like NADH-dependent reductase (Old Yellow Enzyme family)
MSTNFPRVARFQNAAALRAHLDALGWPLPCDDTILPAPESPLASELRLRLHPGNERSVANRFVIQPMEGWDGTADGQPSELTTRRWQNFGRSGAALIWGGEAVAVHADGRANPNQLLLTDRTASAIGTLRTHLLRAASDHGGAPRLVVGLQLTHSGRWSMPEPGRRRPRIAFRHPLLDARVGIRDDQATLTDTEIDDLIGCFANAARLAQEEGFDFVDVKHCHGYLLHEFLAARTRTGRFGGLDLDARTHLLRRLIGAVRDAAPRIGIGVRLSIFDALPHKPDGIDAEGRLGPGVPESTPLPYDCGFGVDRTVPAQVDLAEPIALVRLLQELRVTLLNVTAGSPYYCPHIQRPAAFPPSDGYAPPEDPLVGVARLLRAARDLKRAVPGMTVVSTGWSYLQEFVPHVAQACVREGWCDAVGLGRMALSYPEMPADILRGQPLDRKRICRTFSDCTTAPRNGLVSGCYPLDPFYRSRPEAAQLTELKRGARRSAD